jgi:predicted metal-binding membrane protein
MDGGMGAMPMPAGHLHSQPAPDAGFWNGWAGLPLWTLMCVAMMIPAALPAARHVGLNSLRRRRQRAITGFLVAYLMLWSAFGLLALPALELLRREVPNWQLVAGTSSIAVIWALSPLQVWCRRACHRTVPLPPHGWRAHAGCLRFGLRHGLACIGVCGPLMLVMAVLLHASLVWMILLSVLVVAAKLAPRRFRQPRTLARAWQNSPWAANSRSTGATTAS